MKKKEVEKLIGRYLDGSATPQEQALVEQAYALIAEPGTAEITPSRQETLKTELRDRLIKQLPQSHVSERKISRWIPYAAAAILVLSFGTWLFLETMEGGRTSRVQEQQIMLAATDLPPGGNKAMLTLPDGRAITLDEAQSGIVIGNTGITYNDGREVLGSLHAQDDAIGTKNYVLRTPKGGTYQVTLPDGSSVWLNAESELVYPVRFAADSRNVSVTGEAYFSVVSAVDRPFIVESLGQSVIVLGTEFNLTAYPEEPAVTTTLVSGSVRVVSGAASQTLSPGMQSHLQNGRLNLKNVNPDHYTLWKEGIISFNTTDLSSILRKISRWYDVEFDTTGVPMTVESLYGEINQNLPLSKVLDGLGANTGYIFTVKGRRVAVSQ